MGLACLSGPVALGPGELLAALLHRGEDLHEAILWQVRLPRVLLGALVGAGLATAGAALQGLFRNPLADPGLIGVSSGGAAGAALAIVVGTPLLLGGIGGAFAVPLAALAGAVGVTFLVYTVSAWGGRAHVPTMLLVGVAVNALTAALVGTLLTVADTAALRGFTFWSLGSLAGASWTAVGAVAVFVLPPLLALGACARALNAFLLGEAEAFHLGFSTQGLQRGIVFLSAALVGAGVAFCGVIGFVGLVVPHLARLLVGADHRRVLPAAALGGAFLLVLADLVARTVLAPAELPVGILTALLGAPFFLSLLLRRNHRSGLA